MPESSLPDPRLRRALEELDATKKALRTERVRSGNLRAQLDEKARMAADAKPQPQDQHAG